MSNVQIRSRLGATGESFKYHQNYKKWWSLLNTKAKTLKEIKHNCIVEINEKVRDQVILDVQRAYSFKNHFFSNDDLKEKKNKLSRIITKVLLRNSSFKYYQGFHEICSLFLIVFDGVEEEKCVEAIENFASKHLIGFFDESFDQILREKTSKVLKLVTDYSLEFGRIRYSSRLEREKAFKFIRELKYLIEPHGLMAGWFLTWFVHEFPSLDDSMKIFDFQLMELSSSVNSREPGWSPEVYTAAGLILLHKEKIFNWQDDPFERVVYLRNLPKIASVDQVIECVLLIRAANDGKDLIIIKRWFLFIMILYIGMRLTN